MESTEADRGALLAPVVWAAFAWLYLLVASQYSGVTFYALVRGVGAVRTSDAMVLVSRAFDIWGLAAASAALLLTQFAILRGKLASPLAAGSFVGVALGAAGGALTRSPLFVFLLGVSSLLVASTSLVGLSERERGRLGRPLVIFTLGFAALLAGVALAGDIQWVAGAFTGSTPLRGQGWGAASAGLQLVGVLDPFLPEVLLAFLFSWVVFLALPVMSELGFRVPQRAAGPPALGPMNGWVVSLVLLGVGIVIAAFAALYPYFSAVNPGRLYVGVDIRYCYSNILAGLPVSGPCGTSGAYYELTHFGTFLVLKGLVAVTGSIQSALQAAPPLLGVLLVASSFILALEGTGDRLVAGLAALFAGMSPQLVAGVNAGLMGNWLAISLAFLFFAAVHRGLDTRRLRYVLLGGLLSVLLLVVHPWTWAVAVAVTGAYVLLEIVLAGTRGRLGTVWMETAILVGIVGIAVGADLALTLLAGRSGIEIATSTIFPVLAVPTYSSLALNLRETLVMFLLGGFANPFWYIISAGGVVALARRRDRFGRLLAVWLGAVSLGAISLSRSADPTLMARFVYMVPIPVFAGIGFAALLRLMLGGADGDRRVRWLVFAVLIIAVAGLEVGFTLDNVSYLYRGIPGT